MKARLILLGKPLVHYIARPSVAAAIIVTVLAALFVHVLASYTGTPIDSSLQAAQGRPAAPEFPDNHDWLNTDKPIKMADLKGRIVILDFWTLCCINCIHVMPDLAKLEARYPGVLVVIGVHSPKFDNEKRTASILKAVMRYEIKHPVINDADHRVWNTYGVRSWPTLAMIDPDGKVVRGWSGEGNLDDIDLEIRKQIKAFKGKLKEDPIKFKLAKETPTPLMFPGKVLADPDSKRIFIADSTNHRIVITNLEGKKIAIAGSGKEGFKDGKFADAQFSDPQGMALDGDTLYVADRKNHSIRALDLKKETVKIAAGTGEQGKFRAATGVPTEVPLNSPWDLLIHKTTMYIAMAGHHQIWALDLAKQKIANYAGSGREDLTDGPRVPAGFGGGASAFAQPSGLATDGKQLFVADSETSSIRALPLAGMEGAVTTIVGKHLFEFGDKNGKGDEIRFQHCLGVAHLDGKLYVADTYNSKIKVIELNTDARAKLDKEIAVTEKKLDAVPEDSPAAKRLYKELQGQVKARNNLTTCETYLGDAGWLKDKALNEPGGVQIVAGKMYIADTNNHRIQVVDMKTRAISTLRLEGVEPVRRPAVASKGKDKESK